MLEVNLEKQSNSPLYAQIRDSIIHLVENGEVQSGERLPAVGELAKEWKVTRSTVLRAFKDLTESGYLVSHVGRGTFIADTEESKPTIERQSSDHWETMMQPEFVMAARRLRMGVAKSLEALQTLIKRPGLIQLTSGVPDPSLTNDELLRQLTVDALDSEKNIYREYSPNGGLYKLRKELATWLSRPELEIKPEQILITNGSQQAISILAQVALENNRRIICEVPCYRGILKVFGAMGHWVETIVRNENGPSLPSSNLRKQALLYLCPELHNPMGTDMSAQYRRNIIDWANEQNALLISDEIFRDLRFGGKRPPSFLSEAGFDRTVVIGSLSKSFMCGLRIGWMISSEQRIRSFMELKRAIDIGSPPLMQGIALSLLRSQEYEKHLKKARKHYRQRRDCAIRALERYMPKGVTWTNPPGGFHLWVQLPQGYSSLALFLSAVERGVAILPGPHFDIDHRFMNAFHIGYGSQTPEKIDEGIKLIADAVIDLLKSPPEESGLSGLGDFL